MLYEDSLSLPCFESVTANFIWCHLCPVLEEIVNSQPLCALFGAYSSIDIALAVVQLLMKGLSVSPNALPTAGANC